MWLRGRRARSTTGALLEKYVKLDFITTGHVFAEIEQPISTVDLP
jgi:hypothetical protein